MPIVTLASPALLAAGLAVLAVPVLIHLFMRKQPVALPIPTTRFLKAAQRKFSRKLRLREVLLLLVRCMVLLLAALALARPRWQPEADRAIAGPIDLALVVDTSGSMAAEIGGTPLLARARAWAKQAMVALPKGSRVALVADAERPLRWIADPTELAGELDAMGLDRALDSLAPLVARTNAFVAKTIASRPARIAILTDATRPPLPVGVLAAIDPAVPVQLVDLASAELPNAALEGLELSTTLALPGERIAVAGELVSYGYGGTREIALELGGRVVETRTLQCTAGGRVRVAFELEAPAPGLAQGRIALAPGDALSEDDALYFSLVVSAKVRIVVATDPAYEAGFAWQALQLALDPEERGQRIDVLRTTPGELARRDYRGVQLVILPAIARPPEAGIAALVRFARGGGAVLVLPGMTADLAAWRTAAMKELLGAELVGPEPVARPAGLVGVDYTHPWLAAFGNGANGDLSTVVHRALVRLAPEPGTAVLAQVEGTDLPAITTAPLDQGRTIVIAAGLDPAWSDLPRHPSVVPLLQRAIGHLALRAAPRVNAIAGERVSLAISATGEQLSARIAGPSGHSRVIPLEQDERAITLELDEGPGHYRYLVKGEAGVMEEGGASASADTKESDLARIPATELHAHLGRADVTVHGFGEDAALALGGGSRTVELAPWILVLVLVALGFEGVWSTARRA